MARTLVKSRLFAKPAKSISWLLGVDDIGTVINPMIVEGQIQGGIAQGLGQATCEHCFYDPESGQLLSGSYMDYAVPRASDMPEIVSELDKSQPCTHNPLGAKGCAKLDRSVHTAVVGAVLDALCLSESPIWKCR